MFFFGFGILWVADTGIQTDEALFSAAIFRPYIDRVNIFHHDVPLMVMPYVGALKGWLYAPLLKFFPVSPELIRYPVVVLGCITLWLCYRLLRPLVGALGASLGLVLLATDPVFLLSMRFDWGPVAIQHFCLIASLLCLSKHWQSKSRFTLAVGFFILGVGLWDKAIFAWSLAGLAFGTLVTLRSKLGLYITYRAIVLSTISFVLGASPLVVYNMRNNWATLRVTEGLSSSGLHDKFSVARATLDGSALFGFVSRENIREEESVHLTPVGGRLMFISFNQSVGSPRQTLQPYVFMCALCALPFVWRRHRQVLMFCFSSALVAWSFMLSTKGAGGGAHHVILLWPAPQVIIACALSSLSWQLRPRKLRLGLILSLFIVVAAAATNVCVITTYYRNQIVYGSTVAWTDAITQASVVIQRLRVDRICVLDWGFFDNLRLIQGGRTELCIIPPDINREQLDAIVSDPSRRTAFIRHVPGSELLPETARTFSVLLNSEAYSMHSNHVLFDKHRRPVIEIFVIQKIGAIERGRHETEVYAR